MINEITTNQLILKKKYKTKDLVKLVVDNSNYKGKNYNWKCIFCEVENIQEIDAYQDSPTPCLDSLNKKFKYIIDLKFIHISFVNADKLEEYSIYITKKQIEQFLIDYHFSQLENFDKFTFDFSLIFKNDDSTYVSKSEIEAVEIIAYKEKPATIYDNQKFSF